jgi:hypothetical protein
MISMSAAGVGVLPIMRAEAQEVIRLAMGATPAQDVVVVVEPTWVTGAPCRMLTPGMMAAICMAQEEKGVPRILLLMGRMVLTAVRVATLLIQ